MDDTKMNVSNATPEKDDLPTEEIDKSATLEIENESPMDATKKIASTASPEKDDVLSNESDNINVSTATRGIGNESRECPNNDQSKISTRSSVFINAPMNANNKRRTKPNNDTTSSSISVNTTAFIPPKHDLTLPSTESGEKGMNTTITNTAPSTLLNSSPIDLLLPPARTRVVIEGFDGDKQTAVIEGYSGDGLCHVIDKELNEIFIIPENTFLPLPEISGEPLPIFENGTDVYAVWPDTDTLYPGHVLDNTVDKNNKISLQFLGDNEEPQIESILVFDIVHEKDVPVTALKCESCSKPIKRVKKKINAFATVKCL